jgi:methylated-DNA-[protein]-cysteine S-methyltransferase
MTTTWSTLDTPAGPFTAVVDADGAVLASGWTADLDALLPLVHPALRPAAVEHVDDLGAVGRAVTRYHAGDLSAVDAVPVRQRSGAFLEHAWDVLRAVPAGSPVSYTEYAAKSGRPAAVRAAASACARNAAALFVPCHRVLRTDGTLGGYRWGVDVKRWLLEHEASVVAGNPADQGRTVAPGDRLTTSSP